MPQRLTREDYEWGGQGVVNAPNCGQGCSGCNGRGCWEEEVCRPLPQATPNSWSPPHTALFRVLPDGSLAENQQGELPR